MKIDYHNHILPEENFVENWIKEMDRLGFDKTVFAGLPEYFGFGFNSWTYEAMKKHPDRIIGFGWFNLGVDPPEQVDRFADQGFKGIKFTAPHFSYNDPRAFPVYERIEKLGLATLFHTGIVLVNDKMKGQNCDTARMMPVFLDAPAREFQKMNFHLAHMGVPWHDEAMMMVRLHKNVTADMTGYRWRDRKGVDWFQNQFWFENVWDKMLFGTDVMDSYAQFEDQYRKQKHILDGMLVSPENQAKFFGGNAARLLKLGAD